MISNGRVKLVRRLALKKYRDEMGLFVAEGVKTIRELLGHFSCPYLGGTPEALAALPASLAETVEELTANELAKISFQKTPQGVLAIFQKKPLSPPSPALAEQSLCLALDDIQDPGNMGTIIRVADWFGVHHILASRGTADAFSPKTVQSTMGALARVQVHTVDLPSFFAALPPTVPVYGTFLNGDDMYQTPLSATGVLLMGNEGNGISPDLDSFVSKRLYIPNYPQGMSTSESLNVAIATAISLAEFRRRLSPASL